MKLACLALLCCAACADRPQDASLQHTEFFLQHRAHEILKAAIAGQEGSTFGEGHGASKGGNRGEGHFHVQLAGDREMRAELVALLSEQIGSALADEGLKIRGRGNWSGALDGFSYRYSNEDLFGAIHVFSAVTEGGLVEIRGLIEEYREG